MNIHTRTKNAASALDYPLIAIVATMLALGLVMVYSASFVEIGAEYFLSQLGWIALGTLAAVFVARIPHRMWQRLSIPFMAVVLVLLVAVLMIEGERFGARRTLFSGRVQPSELAKLAVVIYVSAWVTSKGKDLTRVEAGLIPFAILMGLVAGLLVLEPSFSVAIIILTIGVTIFFLGGGDIKQLLLAGCIGGAVLFLLVWQTDYAQGRIKDWWQTLIDPSQIPPKLAQVVSVIRHGSAIVAGPDNLIQKSRVAALWSDFLFANIGADLGFIGTFSVVALYAAWGYRSLGIALNAPDKFGALTAIGITAWILVQAAIHMGSSLALIPATGQPLPFMSYGGSSMLSCMLAFGLLMSISRASPEKKAPYASFAFGWGNRRPRVSDSRGRERDEKDGDRLPIRPGSASGQRAANQRASDIQRRGLGSTGQASSRTHSRQPNAGSKADGRRRPGRERAGPAPHNRT